MCGLSDAAGYAGAVCVMMISGQLSLHSLFRIVAGAAVASLLFSIAMWWLWDQQRRRSEHAAVATTDAV